MGRKVKPAAAARAQPNGTAAATFMLRSSAARREDALQGNAEIQRQERLHVVVRLTAAGGRERRKIELVEARGRRSIVANAGALGELLSARIWVACIRT